MASGSKLTRRRSVATRVLLSYAIVTAAFALALGWSVVAQRNAARELSLTRSGYMPLAMVLRDAVASQDLWNTQLNHITTARNPADIRVWFQSAMRWGRPSMFGKVRAAIHRAFLSSDDENVASVGRDLMRQTGSIEKFLKGDAELLNQLYDALEKGDNESAERIRNQLVTRGLLAKKRLSALEQRVQRNVDELLDEARARERLAIRLLIGLAMFTVLVGILMALYARRVLKPLEAVTARAKAVASGDLTPRPVVASSDEIGELATTFEGMVSAIARANEQLLAAERLATIGKMAAHVTHEIRNPLSSIALNVEMLEEELGDKDTEGKALLRAIGNEVERLTALSGQYLSVARQRPLQLEDEEIGQVVREAAEFMRRDLERHGIEMQLEVDADLPVVPLDEAQLKQALFNLIRNAREAMPDGGRVTVGVRRADGGVEITVDDEGGGIDAETRDRLFEPFFTTKGHGTGLGLAITRQIVQAHGGSVSCHSGTPSGVRMRIRLPAGEAARSEPPAPVAEESDAAERPG